ncbi:unnamed protein product [Aspergillus oryzae]|nr:unnamed protein product [Aspergillus oryzae]
MAAATAKETKASNNHVKNVDEMKVEAEENYVAEQRQQLQLLNARIVRKRLTNNQRWGVCAMCSGIVHNMAGLVACRVGLGVLEAGFGAGVPYYLSLCYKRHELGTRVSILLGSSPIANCIAGAIAYGISQIHSHMEPWRLIFLIGK